MKEHPVRLVEKKHLPKGNAGCNICEKYADGGPLILFQCNNAGTGEIPCVVCTKTFQLIHQGGFPGFWICAECAGALGLVW